MAPMAKEFLVTPIFRSVNPRNMNDVTVVKTRNQNMEVTIKGAQLNTKIDLLIFMQILLRYAEEKSQDSVSFSIRELILSLGYPKTLKN